MITEFITAFLLPVMLALVITPGIIRLAHILGAVDRPGGRKIHESTTPRLGGLAVFLSMLIGGAAVYLLFPGLFEGMEVHTRESYILGFSFLTIFGLGFWDDLKPLKPGIKFGIQFAVASLIYYAGFKISSITNPVGIGILNVEMVDFPLTVLWIVGITNAFNLIDGLDGLAAGVSTIAAISIFTVSALSGAVWAAVFALIFAGSLVGFLRYNFNPARIFLGDSGSLLIGFTLAIISIHSSAKISTGFALLFPILVLGLPITDTLVSMLRRFLSNYLPEKNREDYIPIGQKIRGMFKPDSSHIHHQILSMGVTHRNTVLLLYCVSAFFALGAFSTTRVDNAVQSITIALFIGIILFLGIKKLRYREIAILNNGMMLPVYERWIINQPIFLSLIDLCFIAGSFSLSYLLVSSINPVSIEMLNLDQFLVVILTIQLLMFWLTGVYRETIRQMGIGDILSITSSVGYATFTTAVALFLLDALPVLLMIQFLVLDFYFLLTFTLGIRIAYQAMCYWFNQSKKSDKNVLIYGANENGTMLLHKIIHSPESNLKVLGFLDDNPNLEGKLIYGYPILGGHWKLAKSDLKKKVDHILICEDGIKPENFKRLKVIAESRDITIKRLQVRLKNILSQEKHSTENGRSPHKVISLNE